MQELRAQTGGAANGRVTGPWHCRTADAVSALRSLLARRDLATLICVMALLLKLLLPAGYMITVEPGRVAISPCPGVAPAAPVEVMPAAHAHGHGGGKGVARDHGRSRDHGKADMPCAFAGHSAPALGAVDPLLLVVLIAFILAIGIRPAPRPLAPRPARLRPPLRGPPIRG